MRRIDSSGFRNGLTLFTADDYNSNKGPLSERGGAGQRAGYTKTGLRASPNRITQNHTFQNYYEKYRKRCCDRCCVTDYCTYL